MAPINEDHSEIAVEANSQQIKEGKLAADIVAIHVAASALLYIFIDYLSGFSEQIADNHKPMIALYIFSFPIYIICLIAYVYMINRASVGSYWFLLRELSKRTNIDRLPTYFFYIISGLNGGFSMTLIQMLMKWKNG